MRAIDIKGGKGPLSALFINENAPKPVATRNQALVRIRAFGLNRMDILQREGRYAVPPQAPSTLGVEFSGTIEAIATEQGSFNLGDEVFGLAYGGAYAEYIAVSTHTLIHKPKNLTWEEAAGIPETWFTALQAMYFVGGYKPGQSILWHAGAGGVALAGIQLAKADGASAIYVTTSTQEKIDFCKSAGATEGFNYKNGDWAADLLQYTNGKGVDLIIDVVGAGYFNQNLEAVAQEGHIVSLGTLGGAVIQQPVDISRFLKKRIRYEGSTLRSRNEQYQGKLRDRIIEIALPKFVDGSFKVYIERVFDWKDIQAAHELLAANTTKGKIICMIS
ncbi:uncharacterized protein PV07_03109 [Cladophialophora immunda]|uniref:Enoyl reductase (ER) domain-containing protein n=1 Tax=Cladophialophora immunda TaxID=569365 RepID=A0A0D1ZTR2_9EURO|nr:uncharacterized protein PV07_03109 [Cladophialophora immunda]KIW31461.1 hypothetical protein PV07_03109 [Cladophialophora immunda]OQV08090.1 hypothetical protein CLAIMM_12412 [Cladophialophora immunda]